MKPSEPASVSQTVDGTVIRIEYSRPRARGRDELFGGVVHWDEVWTPGANDATVLELNRDVEIEGRAVPAGRWSVWMVVREEGPWELVLDPRDDLWHTVHPPETAEQIRMPITVEEGGHAEALLWYFPDVRTSGTTLTMAWGEVRVPLEIEVEPTVRYTVTGEEGAPYLGTWEMERVLGGDAGRTREIEIVHLEDGSLRARGRDEERPLDWVLQPRSEGIFALGWTHEGELWASSDVLLEMTFEDDRPVAFAVRSPDDRVIWRGRRVR